MLAVPLIKLEVLDGCWRISYKEKILARTRAVISFIRRSEAFARVAMAIISILPRISNCHIYKDILLGVRATFYIHFTESKGIVFTGNS